MEIEQAKADLRSQLRSQVRALGLGGRLERSQRIVQHLANRPDLLGPTVLTFSALLKWEPDLRPLTNELVGVRWVYPKVEGEGELSLWEVKGPTCLKTGRYGVLEPEPALCEPVESNEVSSVLTPAWAIDAEDGMRLGKGGGYYDRLLAGSEWETVGVVFDTQIQSSLPRDAHDQPVRHVVTEEGWKSFPGG